MTASDPEPLNLGIIRHQNLYLCLLSVLVRTGRHQREETGVSHEGREQHGREGKGALSASLVVVLNNFKYI